MNLSFVKQIIYRQKKYFFFAAFICLLITAPVFSNGKKDTEQTSYPQRIISLSPASTEILCAVGAINQIAARSDFSNYPAEVLEIPSAGGFDAKTLSLEKILSFEPDFVYCTKGMHDHLVQPLKDCGVKVFISNVNSIEDVITEIQTIGEITGHSKKATAVAQKITKTLTEINIALSNKTSKTIYWEVWNSPYMTAGNLSFLNSVIKAAGGNNIFNTIAQAYPVVSEESIISLNPDYIVITRSSGITADNVQKRSGWNNMTAVKKNHIITLDDDLATRPGPRIAQSVLDLAIKLYPDNKKLKAITIK